MFFMIMFRCRANGQRTARWREQFVNNMQDKMEKYKTCGVHNAYSIVDTTGFQYVDGKPCHILQTSHDKFIVLDEHGRTCTPNVINVRISNCL